MPEFEPSIALDDDGLPLWVRIEECMRLLDLALKEAKSRGKVMVDAELEYYSAKSMESFSLLEEGYAVTFIQTVIKGRPNVVKKMSEYHEAEVLYRNANEAINALKAKLRVLENEQERDWEQTKRM